MFFYQNIPTDFFISFNFIIYQNSENFEFAYTFILPKILWYIEKYLTKNLDILKN